MQSLLLFVFALKQTLLARVLHSKDILRLLCLKNEKDQRLKVNNKYFLNFQYAPHTVLTKC